MSSPDLEREQEDAAAAEAAAIGGRAPAGEDGARRPVTDRRGEAEGFEEADHERSSERADDAR